MTHQDDLHSAETASEQPTMELLDGAEAAAPASSSLAAKLARGSLYGVLLLSASALLAVSAVPELANYATFIPDDRPETACHLSSGGCATLDLASLQSVKGSPCCPLSRAMVSKSGCSRSCESSETLAAVSTDGPSCCEEGGSACEKGGECPLALAGACCESVEPSADSDALAQLPSIDVNGPPAPPVAE